MSGFCNVRGGRVIAHAEGNYDSGSSPCLHHGIMHARGRGATRARPLRHADRLHAARHDLDTCEAADAACADMGCRTLEELRWRATVHCSEMPASRSQGVCCAARVRHVAELQDSVCNRQEEVRITKAVSMDRQSRQIMAQVRRCSLAGCVAPANPIAEKGCTYMHIHTQSHLGRSFKLIPRHLMQGLYTILEHLARS